MLSVWVLLAARHPWSYVSPCNTVVTTYTFASNDDNSPVAETPMRHKRVHNGNDEAFGGSERWASMELSCLGSCSSSHLHTGGGLRDC